MKTTKAFLILVLWFLIQAASANAIIYWVGKSTHGSATTDCKTASGPTPPSAYIRNVNDGIACLSGGDTLYIRPGNYVEIPYSPGNGALRNPPSGSSGAPTTVTLYPPDAANQAVIISFSTQYTNHGLFMNSAWVTFDGVVNYGLVLDCGNIVGNSHCVALYASNTRYSRVEFKNTGEAQWQEGNTVGGAGFYIPGSHNTITNCSIHDNGRGLGAAVKSEAPYGMYIAGQGNMVEYTKLYRNGGFGIHGFSTSAGLGDFVFRYNEVYDNGYFYGGRHSSGILATSGINHQVYRNVVYGNFSAGISCEWSTVCYNNTSYNNGEAGMDAAANPASGTQPILRNNILYNNGLRGEPARAYDLFYWNSPITASNNLCGTTTNVPAGACITTQDPQFISPKSVPPNFNLGPTSPAINNGTANIASGITIPSCSTPGADQLNCYRSTAPDIGALESGVPVANINPVLTITSPVNSFATVFPTGNTPLSTITGTATDSDGTIPSGGVTWSCDRCGTAGVPATGSASLSAPGTANTNWTISNSDLRAGTQTFMITVMDNAGGTAVGNLTVFYTPTFTGNTLALALGFEETVGSTAVDSSLNKNSGTLNGGVSYTVNGKFRGGITLNGINQWVQISSAPSLDFTQSFTYSIWVKPFAQNNDFRTLFSKNPVLQRLYASSDTGYCPNNGPMFFATVNEAGNIQVCEPASLVPGQWTHIVVTYDHTLQQLKFYTNGLPRQTVTASGLMQPTTDPLTIGRTLSYGEYFQGDVDEARAYNFAIPAGSGTTPGASCRYANYTQSVENSPNYNLATVLDDMNCPVIPAAPPITMKIPASPTGIGIKASAGAIGLGAQ